jgi:hypothetical protein
MSFKDLKDIDRYRDLLGSLHCGSERTTARLLAVAISTLLLLALIACSCTSCALAKLACAAAQDFPFPLPGPGLVVPLLRCLYSQMRAGVRELCRVWLQWRQIES